MPDRSGEYRRAFMELGALAALALLVGDTPQRIIGPEDQGGVSAAEPPEFKRKAPPQLQPTQKIELPTREPAPVIQKTEVQRLIEKYGPAKSIPAFEYHGDYYNMYPGYYMDPEYFAKQMQWLRDNEVHAVTGEELSGYLNGTMVLPGRSVLLTTDSGVSSRNSLSRMTPVLQETGMHFISFIWTQGMDEGQSSASENDASWNAFREAAESGVFSFGTHTETHRNFGKAPEKDGLRELKRSIDHIEEKLGVKVSGLSWPYEVCAYSNKQLSDIGLSYAFGGTSRPIMEMSVYPNDPLRYCLPRLLPPAPNGVSGRPNNLTIEDIFQRYTAYTK